MRSEWLSEELNERCNHSSKRPDERSYALCAVVLHHGERAVGGHYTTYCRNPDDTVRKSNRCICVMCVCVYPHC